MSDNSLSVVHTDVFARLPGGGNPCPIVLGGGVLSAGQMQAVAARYGQETGFVLLDDDGALRLRFFVPRHEMAMCVHATVAAVTVLLDAGLLEGQAATVRTASGECKLAWDDGAPPRVTVEQQTPVFGATLELGDELEAAAGLTEGALDPLAPIRVVSVSRAKLIVPVREALLLERAEPNFERLWSLCRRVQSTGAYLFAPHPDGRAHHLVARQFPVDAGFAEDAATGVAAAALAAYLAAQAAPASSGWREVRIDQGASLGRPSRLIASALVTANGVARSRVSGTASVQRRERLHLEELKAPGDSPVSELR